MPPDDVQTDGATGEGQDVTGGESADVVGLRRALAAERKARQDAATKLAEVESRRAAEEAEAAAKRGEFERLYNETLPKLTAAEERAKALESRETARVEAAKARNDGRLAALPDAFRALVPDGLDEDARAAQIERVEAIAKGTQFPAGSGAGTGAGAAKKANIPPECIAYAKGLGKTTPEQIEAFYPMWLKTPAGAAYTAKQAGGK